MIQGVTGGVLTAAISGGVLILLVLFVSDGRTSLAGAGAAGAALILLGGQLQGLATGVGQLYESALFVQDFRELTTMVPLSRRLAGVDVPPQDPGWIELRQLQFTYPTLREPAWSISISRSCQARW
jgi:ATP-binding cassette, subfamily B, bacterial